MVNFCAAYGCSNRSNRDKKSFYTLLSVPAERYNKKRRDLYKKRRETWLRRLRREDLLGDACAKNLNVIRVCSDHFISGKPAEIYDETNPDWAPSQNIGHKYSEVKATSIERHRRVQERREHRTKSESALALLALQNQPSNEAPEGALDNLGDTETGISVQTDLTSVDYENLQKENKRLKEELSKYTLDIDGFLRNDEKTLHYTGLPKWQLLYSLYEFVKEYLVKGDNSTQSLTAFQKLLLTLMRMKLNLCGKDLTYSFGGVSEATVSRTFIQVLDLLYAALKPLIRWPERDELKKTMPMDFRKHSPNCVVIIDCFEIFLDRATNPLARAQTYSSYKHHNTVKYLIGITPQGTVSFISDGWGGGGVFLINT